MSFPNTINSPSSGHSSLTRHLISTDLPEPDFPNTTRFSPLLTCRSTPFSTSWSLKDFRSPLILTTGAFASSEVASVSATSASGFLSSSQPSISDVSPPSSGTSPAPEERSPASSRSSPTELLSSCHSASFRISLSIRLSYKVRDLRRQQIYDEYGQGTRYHSGISRNSYTLRSPSGVIPFITTDDPHDESKEKSFDDRRKDVYELQVGHSYGEEMTESSGIMDIHSHITPDKRDHIRKNGQQGDHQRCRQRPGHYQVFMRVDRRYLHGIDLFRHFHGAQLSPHARSHFPAADNGRYHRPDLPYHGDGDHPGDHRNGAKSRHRRTGLDREHQPHNKPRKTDEE